VGTRGLAESERLGPGPAWVWLTRSGLQACGVRYSAGPPALARLAHIRAVTAVRLAFEATSGYRDASGYWRSLIQLPSSPECLLHLACLTHLQRVRH
jgi:hypothetical protein